MGAHDSTKMVTAKEETESIFLEIINPSHCVPNAFSTLVASNSVIIFIFYYYYLMDFCSCVSLFLCTRSGNKSYGQPFTAKAFSDIPSQRLMQVGLRNLPMDVCKVGYRNTVYGMLLDDGMLCAGKVDGGVDTCTVSVKNSRLHCPIRLYT